MLHINTVSRGLTPSKWFKLSLLAVISILLFSSRGLADIHIGRKWADTAPTIDGVHTPGEWNDGKYIPLTNTNARLRTMNDGQFLYVLLDVIDDTGNDPDVDDYYVLSFDVDLNHKVTPYVDLFYDACHDGRPFIKAYWIDDHTSTGCRDTDPLSLGAYGFGWTLHHWIPHRFYEFRLSLNEIGVDPSTWTVSSGDAPKIRVHVGVHSENPYINTGDPHHSLFGDMTGEMFQIDLAIFPDYPAGTAGPIFAGVGLVPSTYIDSTGRANINIPSYYTATDAPFGGKLHIFGHWRTLIDTYGGQKYRVRYSKDGGPLTNLIQTWTNFIYNWTERKWVPRAVGPDGDGKYRIPPPGLLWYLPNLLMSWQSSKFPDGTYTLSLELFDAADNPISLPPDENSLTLFVVNTPPTVTINNVLYNDSPVSACGIITQGASPSGFTFDITVNDDNGALRTMNLKGIYGDNEESPIYSDSYSSHVGEDGPGRWDGESNLIVPIGPRWRAPVECAYSFVLWASSRVQNGYGRLFRYIDYHVSMTILGADPYLSRLRVTSCCGESSIDNESKPAGVDIMNEGNE